MRLLIALQIVLLAACNSFDGVEAEEGKPATNCVPGQQIECSCASSKGFQVCQADGRGYGACSCSGATGGQGGGSGKAGGGGASGKGASGGQAGGGQGGAGAAGKPGSAGTGGSANIGGAAGSNEGGANQSGAAGDSSAAGEGGSTSGAAGQASSAGEGGSAQAGEGGSAGAAGGGGSAQGGDAGAGGGGAAGNAGQGGAGGAGNAGQGGAGGSGQGEGVSGSSGQGGQSGAGGGKAGAGGTAPSCGNGSVEQGEECDDGNKVDDDACSNTCKNAKCGDGVVQSTEVCDLGSDSPACVSCQSYCKGADFFVNTATGSCYKYVPTPKEWENARLGCEQIGPGFMLASLATPEERAFIDAQLTPAGYTWIGGHKQPSSVDEFYWINGEAWSVPETPANWDPGEPDGPGQACVDISNAAGTLADYSCFAQNPSLCERVPASCQEIKKIRGSAVGSFLVDPDGQGAQAPAPVACNLP